MKNSIILYHLHSVVLTMVLLRVTTYIYKHTSLVKTALNRSRTAVNVIVGNFIEKDQLFTAGLSVYSPCSNSTISVFTAETPAIIAGARIAHQSFMSSTVNAAGNATMKPSKKVHIHLHKRSFQLIFILYVLLNNCYLFF